MSQSQVKSDRMKDIWDHCQRIADEVNRLSTEGPNMYTKHHVFAVYSKIKTLDVTQIKDFESALELLESAQKTVTDRLSGHTDMQDSWAVAHRLADVSGFRAENIQAHVAKLITETDCYRFLQGEAYDAKKLKDEIYYNMSGQPTADSVLLSELETRQKPKKASHRRKQPKPAKKLGPCDKVKMAMWLINQMESVEEAEKVFKAAVAAIKCLSEE